MDVEAESSDHEPANDLWFTGMGSDGNVDGEDMSFSNMDGANIWQLLENSVVPEMTKWSGMYLKEDYSIVHPNCFFAQYPSH